MAVLAAHVGVALLIMRAAPGPAPPTEMAPINVQMVELAPPPPPPPPPEPEKPPEEPAPPKVAPPKPVPEKKPPPRIKARVAKAPAPDVIPIPAGKATVIAPAAEVSESELAGAATAESGAGQGCNMAGWLQKKLRGDPRVRAALAEAHSGRALRVWNGDWVRHPGQEGNGLAAVREAIMWEVAFAPVACRKERVRGLVLLSLNDSPGGPRVVLGSHDWAWSDLLFVRRGQASPPSG